MDRVIDKLDSRNDEKWTAAGFEACQTPSSTVKCPDCDAISVQAEWNIIDTQSRLAEMDLRCGVCGAYKRICIALPVKALEFFPLTQRLPIRAAFEVEIKRISDEMRGYRDLLPAVTFMAEPLWLQARWTATTFRCHPTGAAPPTLGLIFEEAATAQCLFSKWVEKFGNEDEFEELRVSIIEGEIPGQCSGYSVHVSPDPENSLIRPGMQGISLADKPLILIGHVRRMRPNGNSSELLGPFRAAYEQHKQYMLAPVIRRDDGKLWFDIPLGIIKSDISFRTVSEIGEKDIDARVVASEPRRNGRPPT